MKKEQSPMPETKSEVPQAEIAIFTLAYDRISAKMFHVTSGWESIRELDAVLGSFITQLLRPAVIQEEARAIIKLQKELKDTEHNE